MMPRFVPRAARTFAAFTLALSSILTVQKTAWGADDTVVAVGDGAFTIATRSGSGVEHYFGTASLDGDARATRALIVLHGVLRNGNDYERSGENAVNTGGAAAAGTIVITPQFLNTGDVRKFHLPAETIRWTGNKWSGGDDSVSPVKRAPSACSMPSSSVLQIAPASRRCARSSLRGHSAGGQLAQRYAIAARSPQIAAKSGVRVRFIVANPFRICISTRRARLRRRVAPGSTIGATVSSIIRVSSAILPPLTKRVT